MEQLNSAIHLVTAKLESWLRQFIIMLPNLVIAILLLIITFYVAKLIRRGAEKVLDRISQSQALNHIIATLVHISAFFIGFFFILNVLNLDKTVTSLLAGVGIIGLALGFAFQDLAANFISGVIIALRKPFGVGDVIETNDHFGTIERINMRTTDIRRQTGELVILPNRKIFEEALINYTHYGIRRIDLEVRVSYVEDLEKVRNVVLEAMQGIRGQIETKEVEVVYNEFGQSAIWFLVRFWVHYARQTDYVYAKSEAIMKIKKAFDIHKVRIPVVLHSYDYGIPQSETNTPVIHIDAPAPQAPQTDPYPKPDQTPPAGTPPLTTGI
jgi:small-conductance mechanosensitive channel